jgi:hypothetical protein
MAKITRNNNDTTANLGFEAKLWAAADALRNNLLRRRRRRVAKGQRAARRGWTEAAVGIRNCARRRERRRLPLGRLRIPIPKS